MVAFVIPAIPAIVEGILWLAGGAAAAGVVHQTAPGKAERERAVSNLFSGSSSPPNEAMMMQGAKDGAGDDATPTAGSGADATNCVGECEDEEQRGKDAKRMSDRELEKAAKANGYEDAHALKRDYGINSRSDIFKARNGDMYIGPRKGTGRMEPMRMNVKGSGFER